MRASVELRQISFFIAVSETGSFRQAANRLNVGQSAISRSIQKLEDALGVSLFERRPNGARLTNAGGRFATNVRAILESLDTAIEAARAAGVAENGQLKIGIIASLSRGPSRRVISRFLEVHGDVDLQIIETDRSELLTLLSHRRMDAIVAAGEPEVDDRDALLLAREHIFLAVPSDHRWAGRELLSWDDVREATFVVSSIEPGPQIHDYLVRKLADLGRRPRLTRHRLGREGIMNLVGLGLGVSLVAEHWCGVSYPNVTFVRVGEENETVPFSLIWRPENDNPALRRFISLARIEAKRNGALS
ncbi:LysR substrate-binding domain-containing protein [Algihabitans albus]|uniref:LysR family transcriptional regulator n=1 Tax=Algihabitans albus TaxID=2164067 RepID=UPI0035CEDDC1